MRVPAESQGYGAMEARIVPQTRLEDHDPAESQGYGATEGGT